MMKLVLVVALVLAPSEGQSATCDNNRDLRKLSRGTQCRVPQETTVQLKVPDGFLYVIPSTVKVKRCSGNCDSQLGQCSPVEEKRAEHQVKAYKERGGTATCVKVEIMQHMACDCSCDAITCPSNMVLNRSECGCECDPAEEAKCNDRREQEDKVMWSENNCSCRCDDESKLKCRAWESWNEIKCRCEPSNEV